MKKTFFLINWQSWVIFLSICVSFHAYSNSADHTFLTIGHEPTSKEWRYFFEMTESDREALWNHHILRKQRFQDWSWQWRIAWIRACALSNSNYCGKIMATGLKDDAIVVRVEAASRIGDRFAGTEGKFPLAIRLLVEAYQNPANDRNGEPLFIKYRILEALKKISGSVALNQAEKISQSSSLTKDYWQKLNY